MKTTVNLYDFRDAFRQADRMENFSYEGLEILFDYFEQIEEDSGQELELDVIAICCEYNEDTFEDIASNYSINIEGLDEDDAEEAVLEYLNENTSVIGIADKSIIYAVF
jgi:hypothetical protein